MADQTTPLLPPRTNSAESQAQVVVASLDEVIEHYIGDFGLAQFLQVALVSLAWAFDAQQTFISIFADAYPTWHCTDTCGSDDICRLPRTSWAWDTPVDKSIVSEWSLECAGSVLTGLPASSFFLGCLVGGLFLASLADSSLGRKNMLMLSCLLMSVTGILTVFSSNIWTYSALRFVSGLGRATVGTSALVLATEFVGKRWRGQAGIFGFLCFMLGFLSLPAIAYLNRGSSWRAIYICTCAPTVFYCALVHFFVHESPRWLFLRGRKDEFIATLKSISSKPANQIISMTLFEKDDQDYPSNLDLYSAISMLVKKNWAMTRLSALMGVSFGMGLVYYGIPLGLGNLAFNLYLSVTLNAISELPASLVTLFLIGRLNRKTGILGFTMLSGVCSITCCVLIMTSNIYKLQIGLELVSFFGACTAFNMVLVYTLELFPTCVRNSALSVVRQAVVLGGVFSPVLVAAGRKSNGILSYGVFGVAIGLSGLLVTFLPETRGRPICDTMAEEEKQFKESGAATLPSFLG